MNKLKLYTSDVSVVAKLIGYSYELVLKVSKSNPEELTTLAQTEIWQALEAKSKLNIQYEEFIEARKNRKRALQTA